MTAAVVEARGIGVTRGDRRTVSDVDLVAHRGEVIALVGPNGAGKSTLLSVLAGDLTPDAGHVLLEGEPLEALRPEGRALRRAVMTQSSSVAFPFTVADVVAMGRAPWRRRPEADQDEALMSRAVDDADVAHLLDRTFSTLSGGEQARVVLARTLAQDTPLLLLDEPTAALDLQHQTLVAEAMRRRAERGGAVVVVLHDLGLAGSYADRVVVLDGGAVVIDAAPEDALDEDLLGRVYGQQVEVVRSGRGRGWLVAPVVSGPTSRLPQAAASHPERAGRRG